VGEIKLLGFQHSIWISKLFMPHLGNQLKIRRMTVVPPHFFLIGIGIEVKSLFADGAGLPLIKTINFYQKHQKKVADNWFEIRTILVTSVIRSVFQLPLLLCHEDSEEIMGCACGQVNPPISSACTRRGFMHSQWGKFWPYCEIFISRTASDG